MENHNHTQNQRVLDYMHRHGSLTQIEALRDIGVLHLASRISDLLRLGYRVESSTENVKNRFGEKCRIKRYSLGE